jgi:hypothetical protein
LALSGAGGLIGATPERKKELIGFPGRRAGALHKAKSSAK